MSASRAAARYSSAAAGEPSAAGDEREVSHRSRPLTGVSGLVSSFCRHGVVAARRHRVVEIEEGEPTDQRCAPSLVGDQPGPFLTARAAGGDRDSAEVRESDREELNRIGRVVENLVAGAEVLEPRTGRLHRPWARFLGTHRLQSHHGEQRSPSRDLILDHLHHMCADDVRCRTETVQQLGGSARQLVEPGDDLRSTRAGEQAE